jgi:hypothetical protein
MISQNYVLLNLKISAVTLNNAKKNMLKLNVKTDEQGLKLKSTVGVNER